MEEGKEEQSPAPYSVMARNRQVAADWEVLKRQRPDICRRCWEHLSTNPRERIGSRYVPLRGPQKFVDYQGQMLPQWQYEIDNRARVKLGIGDGFVVIISVATGHPRENE